jgi:hypothetical protein
MTEFFEFPTKREFIDRFTFNKSSHIEQMTKRLEDAMILLYNKIPTLNQIKLLTAKNRIIAVLSHPFYSINNYIKMNSYNLILAEYCIDNQSEINMEIYKELSKKKRIIENILNNDFISILQYIQLLLDFNKYEHELSEKFEKVL